MLWIISMFLSLIHIYVTALNCIKAEALALRGLALFDLTRLFAMPYTLDNGASLGVPIEIKTTLPTHQPARNTVAECYQQVIDDMTGALDLSALSTDKKDGYLNVWSVKALLSRVYLYMNNNEQALALAKEVMDNGGLYKLFTHEEYPTVWGKDFSSESLVERSLIHIYRRVGILRVGIEQGSAFCT